MALEEVQQDTHVHPHCHAARASKSEPVFMNYLRKYDSSLIHNLADIAEALLTTVQQQLEVASLHTEHVMIPRAREMELEMEQVPITNAAQNLELVPLMSAAH